MSATFKLLTDSRGFRWNISPQGTVTSGVRDDGGLGCLAAAGILNLTGAGIAFPKAQMTSDGREFVFSTNSGPLRITRRVRLDDREDVMRILDVFENTVDENVEMKVLLSASVASGVRHFLTTEKVFNTANTVNDQDSILAMPLSGGPSVVLLLADPQGKTKPQLARRSANQIGATYILDLKAGESAAIVHYVAQRTVTNSTDGAATIKPLFARLMRDGKLLDPSIPAAIRSLLVNFSMGEKSEAIEASQESALTALRSALDGANLSRGKTDGVALDTLGKLAGTVTGGDFSVETEFGKAPIAIADVAGIAGGAGVQRPVRVFLRDGEVLAGAVSGAKFAMQSDMGFSPEQSENLPLSASYPLLLGNAIQWTTQAATAQLGGRCLRTGDTLTSPGTTLAWVQPDGTKLGQTRLRNGWVALDRAGLWQTDAGETGSAALLSAHETALPAGTAAVTAGAAGPGWLRGDLAWPLLWMVLGVLLVESWLFHRHAVF